MKINNRITRALYRDADPDAILADAFDTARKQINVESVVESLKGNFAGVGNTVGFEILSKIAITAAMIAWERKIK